VATDGARDTRSCSSTGNPGDQPLSANVRPAMRSSTTGYGALLPARVMSPA
jgi:hypothetical protein